MKQLNYNIKALGYIQDASANIYSLTNLTVPIWTGTVNSTGKVVDSSNNSPYLSYGDYRVIIEKCDYDIETSDFRVPDASIVNLTVGCSSAITAHESIYDHSKLATINTDILAGLIPTYSNFSVFPLPTDELTDNDYDDFTTVGTTVGGTSLITFNLGVLKYVSVIPYTLKYQLWGSWYSGSCPYSMFQVNVFNGIIWIPLYNEQISPVCGVSGTTYYNTGLKTINGLFTIYDNISQIQIKIEANPNGTYNTANASVSGTRIRVIG